MGLPMEGGVTKRSKGMHNLGSAGRKRPEVAQVCRWEEVWQGPLLGEEPAGCASRKWSEVAWAFRSKEACLGSAGEQRVGDVWRQTQRFCKCG